MLYVDYVAPVFPGGSYVNVQRGSYFKILFQYSNSWKVGSMNLEGRGGQIFICHILVSLVYLVCLVFKKHGARSKEHGAKGEEFSKKL